MGDGRRATHCFWVSKLAACPGKSREIEKPTQTHHPYPPNPTLIHCICDGATPWLGGGSCLLAFHAPFTSPPPNIALNIVLSPPSPIVQLTRSLHYICTSIRSLQSGMLSLHICAQDETPSPSSISGQLGVW